MVGRDKFREVVREGLLVRGTIEQLCERVLDVATGEVAALVTCRKSTGGHYFTPQVVLP